MPFIFIRRLLPFLLLLVSHNILKAQVVEAIYKSYIGTPQLYESGNQLGLPVYSLGGNERLQLEFDDLEGNIKNYFYTFVLCDYNWKPANLSSLDYLRGFTQVRISNYRFSSLALTRYTHYQTELPGKDCVPTRSGNYLLKVFLDGDTSKLVFTRQMLVVDPKTAISAEIVQPFTPEYFKTHQKVRFTTSVKDLNTFSAAQQIKVVIMQNNRWDLAQRDIPPTYVRNKILEYNSEQHGVFPGGKEWRWADFRNFRLQSDRVERATYNKTSTEVFMKVDRDRSGERYIFFSDLDGAFWISSFETPNASYQGDYATVNFYFQTPDGRPLRGRDLYLSGQFTSFSRIDKWKMTFNEEKGLYEGSAFLKNGFYNYTYTAIDPSGKMPPLEFEGNYWETENSYTILVYYKGFTDRCDQLIGVSRIDSRRDRPGFRF